ncbi:potassium channel family protein [Microbulbifer sp. ALW1]|uniref:potassium channel family protein n=1 Tax=Microbulbifer sp. (strain ALW1) TaxID=1516059 RepID=UPI00135836E6|nr:potassium channel family protein [Microbulbifer sp. ALW1]
MLLSFLINAALVSFAVVIHHEVLNSLFFLGHKLKLRRNLGVLIGVFGALVGHVLEIWMFAVGYYFMYNSPFFGTLTGNFNGTLIDCVYFSFTTYTSLGFGDVEPHGELRFTAGLEALTGLVLITWTASFLFLKMQRYWKRYEEQS